MRTMTPQLRFPEFTDKWQVKKLGDLANTVNGLTYSPSSIRKSGVLVLRSSNIKHGQLDFTDSVFVDEGLRYNESKKGDILICVRNGSQSLIGKNVYVDKELPETTHGAFMSVLRSDESKFIYQLFQTNNYKKQVSADLGARINSINNAQLLKYKFSFPSKPEQEKIADFFTAVDERIGVSEKKLELLETYKRGVMQKIFSQKVRFKDENGSPYPDWKEKAVSEFLKERKEYTSKGGDLEHISLTTAGVVPKSERYERDFLVGSTDKQYRITRLDDICYNPANLKFGVIARNKYKDGIFSPIYVTYVVNNADIGFVEYLVTSRDFIQRARKYEQGTVYERMAVSPQDLAKIKVRTPVIEEQQKIANFLTTLDDKITAEKSKLTATREFKKALLQRMFV